MAALDALRTQAELLPDRDGEYLLTAVAPAAAADARLEEMLSARNSPRQKRKRSEGPADEPLKDTAKRQRTGEQQHVSHLLQLSRELQVTTPPPATVATTTTADAASHTNITAWISGQYVTIDATLAIQ